MKLTFDPLESERNRRERNLPFEFVLEFEWETALIIPDERFAYPEVRFRATGRLRAELYMVVFTRIQGGIQVISLRRASRKERRIWQESRIPI